MSRPLEPRVVDALDPQKLKVTELKQQLSLRKLDIKGKKAELVDRLTEAIQAEKLKTQEKEDVNVDEEETVTHTTNTSTTAPFLKKKELPSVAPKEINNSKAKEQKPLNEEERKKQRAERFKTTIQPLLLNEDDRKKKRGERFGASHETQPIVRKEISTELVGSPDKQRKRMEKFGLPIKPKEAGDQTTGLKVQNGEDKKEKRLQRFASNMPWSPEEEEKKRKRAERFGASETSPEKKLKVEKTLA